MPSVSGRSCAICGRKYTQDSHVKAQREFTDEEISEGVDRIRNIVQLCHNHHSLMDDGWVAIAPSGNQVTYSEGAERVEEELHHTVNIAPEYIQWRNQYSNFIMPYQHHE